METLELPLIDYAVARFVLPGQGESGDHHLIWCTKTRILVGVIDGVGHGEEAAKAAKAAISILRGGLDEPIISLVRHCHEELRSTRGVVLSLAFIDPVHGMMTWLGVGNVQGILIRGNPKQGASKEFLLLRGGVVGSQLPPLQAAVLPITQGDTLIFATDGVHGDFAENLSFLELPKRTADRIIERYRRGNDDALVLVARLTGIRP
jgi:phosphoserine phosphatase RsbX